MADVKKANCELGEIIAEEIGGNMSDLVTRNTGVKVRERLAEILEAGDGGLVVSLDFSKVGIVDFSCADEVLAKLLSRLMAGEYGLKYICLKGLNEHQKENIQVALERKKLAVMDSGTKEKWEIVGVLNPYLIETLEFVMKKGRVTARQMADDLMIELNTSGTRLLNLFKKRMVARIEEILPEGGRRFTYRSII